MQLTNRTPAQSSLCSGRETWQGVQHFLDSLRLQNYLTNAHQVTAAAAAAAWLSEVKWHQPRDFH